LGQLSGCRLAPPLGRAPPLIQDLVPTECSRCSLPHAVTSMDVAQLLGSRLLHHPLVRRVDVLLLCWFVFCPCGPWVCCACVLSCSLLHTLSRRWPPAKAWRECFCSQACCSFPTAMPSVRAFLLYARSLYPTATRGVAASPLSL